MKEISNDLAREKFEKYMTDSMKPNLELVAQKIGVSYFTLIKWRTKKIDLAEIGLKKVLNFLNSKQTA